MDDGRGIPVAVPDRISTPNTRRDALNAIAERRSGERVTLDPDGIDAGICAICRGASHEHETKAREQALIVLSGIALASLLALACGLTSVTYAFACKSGVSSMFCALARYKDWLYELPALVLAAFFALAVLFPGEIDAAKLFRRTTLYGALGWLLIFGFAALEHLLDDLFGRLLSDEAPRVIAAGAIGMAVHPVKRRLEDGIDALLKKVLGTASGLS